MADRGTKQDRARVQVRHSRGGGFAERVLVERADGRVEGFNGLVKIRRFLVNRSGRGRIECAEERQTRNSKQLRRQ